MKLYLITEVSMVFIPVAIVLGFKRDPFWWLVAGGLLFLTIAGYRQIAKIEKEAEKEVKS